MWTRQYKRRNTGRLVVPALCAAFLAYFGFHALHGEYGIYSKYRLEAETEELKADHAALRARREMLERRVALLNDGSLDKDMLDEQARKSLNLSSGNELIIMRPLAERDIN